MAGTAIVFGGFDWHVSFFMGSDSQQKGSDIFKILQSRVNRLRSSVYNGHAP